MRLKCYILGTMTLLVTVFACKKNVESEPVISYATYYEPGEEYSAGSCTSLDHSAMAFSYQVDGLSHQQQLDFFVGNSFFNQNWVEAPSSTTARDGVGPLFNARSCSGCHFRDGRGEPETGNGLLFRLSIAGNTSPGGPIPHEIYGGQLQDFSVLNVPTEGSFEINYTEQTFAFPDGETYSLRTPYYQFNNLMYGDFPNDLMLSPRIGQQMIGLGLLENIAETDLIQLADPSDKNGDGISGKVNMVYDPITQNTAMGRFGWKANVANLYQQTAGAFLGDIGITSWLFPDENCTSAQNDCSDAINGGTPEIDTDDLEATILYTRTLAVPIRRNFKSEKILEGKKLFHELGCANCHQPVFTTSDINGIEALSQVTIRPYSDLLLHDMGAGLADNRPDFGAGGSEWRTQPLWGLGLIQTVNGHNYLLHDGRARSILEAIMWHGGEADASKNNFSELNAAQRQAVISFLESL
jgi:CxxC motif-containing protein (DUF1111 family)